MRPFTGLVFSLRRAREPRPCRDGEFGQVPAIKCSLILTDQILVQPSELTARREIFNESVAQILSVMLQKHATIKS